MRLLKNLSRFHGFTFGVLALSWTVAAMPCSAGENLDDSPSPLQEKKKANELGEYLESYRAGAEAGDPQDQYNLGASYRWGIGVSQNQGLAIQWIRKSAENGYPLAQRTLAGIYEKGEGVPRSDADAALWYRRAARQGDSHAQESLAALEARTHPAGR